MSQAKEEGSTTKNTTSEALASEIHGTTDLVSKLPTREGWSEPLVLYKNYWFRPHLAANIMHVQNSFKPRHDDTILALNPKCGTTWMKALAFTITSRFREAPISKTSHHPYSPLAAPNFIASWGCRVVYMCRDPKDTFVSRWHFENRVSREPNISLEYAFSMFSEGFSAYGPFWYHCLEYWKESIANPDKVLFLKYEDIILEPVKYVIRLATFLGAPFSTKEEEDGIPEEVVRLCSFEKLSNLQTNQTGEFSRRGNLVLEKSAFFRKGKVGDWVNHMSEEMGRKLDSIMDEKLKGSGLVL
ncbi:unnamed protein product [Urochloa decumbens]|uniref:Sulfotransferase n=1 Tax=Urochloa decumbens TaxID=240449 RepID=A0ABC9BKX5_9POAL